MAKRRIIIYLYNQLFDPVIQSNIFLYIKDLAKNQTGSYQFAIISFEKEDTLNDKKNIERIKRELASFNIVWYPHRWHQGTSLYLKLMDFSASFFRVFILRISGYSRIISLASVAGAYAYLFSLLLGLRLYLYQYEPHSEYEVDSGTYTESSTTFKILNFLEKRSALFALVISSGTHHMMDRLTAWKVRAKLFKIPSVVNEEKFTFDENDRHEIRTRYGIGNDKIVLYYPGKFGGLYFKEETIEMFNVLLEKEPRFHALVVTPNPIQEIENYFLIRNMDRKRFTVTSASFVDIQKYNSAADFAIIAVPPGPSKKFVSNIKVGEYLCSGLPYLICQGVSEDDEYASNYQVGVVVKDFSKDQIAGAHEKIIKILEAPANERRRHCRKVGIDYRGFAKLNREFKIAIDALFH